MKNLTLVARQVIAPVVVGIAILIAPVPLAIATTATATATPESSASLSAHGGGIYKHLWLDAIGPQVYVPHVDTTVHQSR